MKKATERRLAAVEQRLSATQTALHVITVHGGFSGPIAYAAGGGRIWERATDESFEAFEARVIADAKAARLKQVVIGGLPPDDVELGNLEDFLNRFQFSEVPPEEL